MKFSSSSGNDKNAVLSWAGYLLRIALFAAKQARHCQTFSMYSQIKFSLQMCSSVNTDIFFFILIDQIKITVSTFFTLFMQFVVYEDLREFNIGTQH